MIAWEPDLFQVCLLVFSAPFPDCRTEWRASLVEGKCLEGILNAVRQRSVMPHICAGKVSTSYQIDCEKGDLFLVCGTNTHFVEPSDIWDTEATNRVPDANGLDLNQVATGLLNPREAHLLEP